MELVDVHAHITDEQFDDIESVIARAKDQGVTKIICSSASLSTSQQAVALALLHFCHQIIGLNTTF